MTCFKLNLKIPLITCHRPINNLTIKCVISPPLVTPKLYALLLNCQSTEFRELTLVCKLIKNDSCYAVPRHLSPAKAPHNQHQPPYRHSAGASACHASGSHLLPVKTARFHSEHNIWNAFWSFGNTTHPAYKIFHIIVWEGANGSYGSNEPFRQWVFALNTLHDVPHSRAHVELKDISPRPGDAAPKWDGCESEKNKKID